MAASVLLVSMPFAPLQRPSLALGILKSLANTAGIDSSVLHPYLDFAELLGVDTHELLTRTACEEGLIEWIFAPLAFPDVERDDARFIERFIARNPRFPVRSIVRFAGILGKARKMAARLLDMTVAQITAAAPRVVGCTSMFQQHVASLALLRRLKQRLPGVVTMMGGPNCETHMGCATHRNYPWVDYVVSGEAEELFIPLLEAILAEGTAVRSEHVPFGVFAPCHRAEGYPVAEGGDGVPRATVANIELVPQPDFSDYFHALEKMPSRERVIPAVPLETARGCWWGARSHCTFCGLNGTSMSFRAKSPERVIDEIGSQMDRYGIQNIGAVDNIIDIRYFETVLPELARCQSQARLFFETKSNLKRKHVAMARAANVVAMQPGIESLSTAALKHMGKGVQAWQNIQFLRFAAEQGLRTIWTSLVGFPDEIDDWHAEAASHFHKLTHLEPGGVSRVRYDRYSPLFKRADAAGICLRPFEGYQHIYPVDGADLFDQSYFFEEADSADLDRPWQSSRSGWLPGARLLAQGARTWRREWIRNQPICAMIETRSGLVIKDTRACATAAEHSLDGLATAIMRSADEAPPEHRLREEIARSYNIGAPAVAAALDCLASANLILRIDGRVLALPTSGEPRPRVSEEQWPLGMVRYVPEKVRSNHALR